MRGGGRVEGGARAGPDSGPRSGNIAIRVLRLARCPAMHLATRRSPPTRRVAPAPSKDGASSISDTPPPRSEN